MTFFHIGHLTIPSIWIAVLLAMLFTTVVYRFINKKKIGGWFSDAIFNYIVVWKLSYIIFNFSLFIDYPLGIVYFNGGREGHWLAIIVVVILLWRKVAKEKMSQEVLPVFLLFYFLYKVTFYSLEQDWLFAMAQLLLVFVYIVLLRSHKIVMTQQAYIAFFVVQLLLLSVKKLLFTVDGLTFGLLATVSWIVMVYFSNNWRDRMHG